MRKLVVSDFDGTLKPFESDRVSEAVRNRIDALLDRGVEFAVSSGRTYGELLSFLPEFRDRIYFICNDGAVYLKNGKPLYEKQIETADLGRFFELSGEYSCVLHGLTTNFCVGALHPGLEKAFSPIPVKSVYAIREKIYKVTTAGKQITLPQNAGIRTHWDGGPEQMAQFVNRFATKGSALSDLQVRLMLTRYDTACIGDAGNDIPMMAGAKYSICIGERSRDLSAVCTHKKDTVEEALDFCLSQF